MPAGLGSAGIRAELDHQGALKFSMPENDWQALKDQLRVKGEGKLFAAAATQVQPTEEGLLGFDPAQARESVRDLRQLLDSVVAALDRIGADLDQARTIGGGIGRGRGGRGGRGLGVEDGGGQQGQQGQ